MKWILMDIIKGLKTTWNHLMAPCLTVSYPEQSIPVSNRFRGIHALRRDQHGEELCIACKLCEAVCPAVAITIEPEEREDLSRGAALYEIDLFKCIFCGLCEQSCPVDAIVQTKHADFVIDKRGDHILDKTLLLALGDRYEQEIQDDRKERVGE